MPQTIEQLRREVIGKPQHYALAIDRAANIDPETRTVELAFASDKPIDHWFGKLSLSMGGKNVRTERLSSAAPLLMDHNTSDMVGVIESHSFGADGIARAVVKFSRSARGEEIFQDVRDGIRQLVSVGFMVHELNLEKSSKDGLDEYRADDWEPFEISLVSVPADISVGVGRSMALPADPAETVSEASTEAILSTLERRPMLNEETLVPGTPVVETRSAEMIVADEIREWGKNFDSPELAAKYLRDCKTAVPPVEPTQNGFFAAVRAKQTPTTTIPVEQPADIAERQGGNVQLARTVSRVNLQAFKGPKAHENAYRSAMHLAAVLMRDENAIRYCRENGIAITRTQTGTENTKGGFTVIPEFDQTIFELLLQYGVARRVTDVVPMSSDTKLVTRRTGGLTAYAVGAGQRGTYSTATQDQFELVARKWMVLAKIEDELSEDSFMNWVDKLANESAYAFSFSEDDCLFNADGTSTYHGIVGITQKILGLSATRANIAGAVVASGNTWDEIVIGDLLQLVGKLPSFARQSGNVRWYCTSEFWATVLQRLALAGGGVTHAEFEGQLKESFLGKPVEIVEAMQHTAANDTIPLLYGNMSQAVTFGDRRGITVKMTDSNDTDFESDLQAIKSTERFDLNVHDVGNASATAGLRKAGPVVALLTAAS